MSAVWRGFFALSCLLVLGGCDGSQSALSPSSSNASHLKTLIVWIVAICSLVWAVVMMALLRALFRPRGAASRSFSPRRAAVAIAAGLVATVVIISGFTVASFLTTQRLGDPAKGDLRIAVRGYQWWWQVTYLDAEGAPLFQTANEIHIPIGKTVSVRLEAADVIHSFWVPSLAGKQDLVPGRINHLRIQAERPGVYRGQCAEFCGFQHSHMAMLVVAQSEDDFAAWRATQQRGAAPSSEDVKAGEAVFMSKPCAACHSVRGTAAAGTIGPDLTHFGGRRTLAAGLLDNTQGSLAAWLADPQRLKPGNNMPQVPLSGEELRQVSAYLGSLK